MQKMTEYVAKYQKLDITEQLNQVYESESSSLDPELTNIQVVSIGNEKWERNEVK